MNIRISIPWEETREIGQRICNLHEFLLFEFCIGIVKNKEIYKFWKSCIIANKNYSQKLEDKLKLIELLD